MVYFRNETSFCEWLESQDEDFWGTAAKACKVEFNFTCPVEIS